MHFSTSNERKSFLPVRQRLKNPKIVHDYLPKYHFINKTSKIIRMDIHGTYASCLLTRSTAHN